MTVYSLIIMKSGSSLGDPRRKIGAAISLVGFGYVVTHMEVMNSKLNRLASRVTSHSFTDIFDRIVEGKG